MKRGRKRKDFDIYIEETDVHQNSRKIEIIDYLMECFCMLLLIYGCVYGLFASCGVLRYQRITLFLAVLIIMITFGLLSYEENHFYWLGYVLICAILLLLSSGFIVQGARYFAASYVKLMNRYFGLNLKVLIDKKEEIYNPKLYLVFFQVFLICAVTFFVGIIRKISKKSLLALIFPILIFALIFAVGLIPQSRFLFTFLIGFLPLSLSCKGENAAVRFQAKLITFAGTGILVLMFICFLPRAAVNDNIALVDSVRQDIANVKDLKLLDELEYYFSDSGGEGNNIFSNEYKGKKDCVLGDVDSITFDHKTDFVFTSDLNDLSLENYEVYLRSYVGSNYENCEWKDLKKEQQQSYRELSQKYNYNFENLLTDALRINNIYRYGEFDEERMFYANYKIEKKRIARKSMLLPYGLKGDVKFKNGHIYTDESYTNKVYTEAGSELVLKPYYAQFDKAGYTDLEMAHAAMNLMNQYTNMFENELTDNELEDPPEEVEDADLNTFGSELKRFAEEETSYRKFVYDTYTNVPEGIAPELRKTIKRMLLKKYEGGIQYESNFDDSIKHIDIVELVINCMKFLYDHANYSLNPGKTPEDKDFVDYFLYENKKGYCTYFATAANIYLRLCGVPTRYVEGYKITSNDIRSKEHLTKLNGQDAYKINVTDEKAHAWIEVYMSGLGWVPFDVTPGIGPVGVEEEESKDSQNTAEPSLEASATPSQPKEPEESSKDNEPTETVSSQSETGSKELTKDEKPLLWVVRGIILAVILAAMLTLRWGIIREMNKRKVYRCFNNDRVKFYYHQVEKISKVCGKKETGEKLEDRIIKLSAVYQSLSEKELEEFVAIAEKATFGSGQISDYECTKCAILYQKIRNQLYKNAGVIKRIYYHGWKVF